MNKFHMISGLPRSGSTLLCQLLNMNVDFKATTTSPVLDMLMAQQSCFSHNPGFKATNRMESYDSFRKAQHAFLDSFYADANIVFDKNRGWPCNILMLDEIMGNADSKVIWTYRDPVHIVCSVEEKHRKTPLIQFTEESTSGAFRTLSGRINSLISDDGIVGRPGWLLHDAVEMGYADRILVVGYGELCADTQGVLDDVHDFLGLPRYSYSANNFTDLKQTTHEYDTFYNHKYPHDIKEGSVTFKEPIINIPESHVTGINERFAWVNDYSKACIAQRRSDRVLKDPIV